jgi:hypothetical protein
MPFNPARARPAPFIFSERDCPDPRCGVDFLMKQPGRDRLMVYRRQEFATRAEAERYLAANPDEAKLVEISELPPPSPPPFRSEPLPAKAYFDAARRILRYPAAAPKAPEAAPKPEVKTVGVAPEWMASDSLFASYPNGRS